MDLSSGPQMLEADTAKYYAYIMAGTAARDNLQYRKEYMMYNIGTSYLRYSQIQP